ncbi:pesticin C-terminus-like muramidase [Pseudomonas sp. PDM19]|uniref:pesticin C-terminus-like muramidase n=1 Tax=Pseudomonas sp. PDM19 TaxID=2769272 RepID=UPI0017818492|nr:pesticin C-terminus-like muramidase [Pseudomonas sp. PDM19]MBD9633904.1 hypothetical protein [Pseudomonas sp. PDM19]
MLSSLSDLYEGLKDEYRRWRYGPPPPQNSRQQPPASRPAAPPPVPVPPTAAPAPAPAAQTPSPLKNWSYPFKVQTGGQEAPISQLTHMSKALAGFYPLGINGMWHGGVHFDAGTASALDQSHVSCLADGEVVAYRIPTVTPKTTYHKGHDDTVSLPFASGFVLVRHRLQAPAIEGATKPPPSLVFYSLYMHLEDWASYQADAAKARPVFWAASSYRVKNDVADPGPIGLTVHDKPSPKGAIVSVLPRGTRVTIGGSAPSHGYVKLVSAEGIELPALGPQHGTARGYVRLDALDTATGAYRVKDNALGQKPGDQLNIHATAAATSKVTGTLARGTELVVSGDGAYRKLEAVIPQGLEGDGHTEVPELPAYGGDYGHQAPEGYVRFAALAPLIAPLQRDSVALPDPPIPIKAGQLIGHIGVYHDMKKSEERKLHLEVFTAQDMVKFLADSRDWARQLPESERTWLKLAKGTRVISHQDSYKKATPPTLQDAGKDSADDLLIPRSLLDGLRAEWKIQLPAAGEQKARNWYRLDGLLNDDTGNLIDGWVCEEVGVTPWVSPWAWEGYDIIVNVNPLEEGMAYFKQLHSDLGLQAMADRWDKGPLQTRLYDIIGTGPDNKLTAAKIKRALEIPARAQSIAQLVIQYESEWRYTAKRMEPLDKLLGHTRTEPILNWIAEKGRRKALGFWDDVWGKVGLPEAAKVYHLHPTGFVCWLKRVCPKDCTTETYELDTTKGTYRVTKESFEYILKTEGFREKPYVPGGASGVTIGYGYDLGQQKTEQVRIDLSGIYSDTEIDQLVAVIGKQGDNARSVVGSLSGITISKPRALELALKMKKRYAQLVVEAYPQSINLHPHCQGALLSLVINRGNSLDKPDLESRLEMAQIADDLNIEKYELIPSRLRSMKRLWIGKPGMGGLITRREAEAKLFERGLKCDC